MCAAWGEQACCVCITDVPCSATYIEFTECTGRAVRPVRMLGAVCTICTVSRACAAYATCTVRMCGVIRNSTHVYFIQQRMPVFLVVSLLATQKCYPHPHPYSHFNS